MARASRCVMVSVIVTGTIGCYAQGTKIDREALLTFIKGQSTCAQMIARFGPPTQDSLDDQGNRQLTYLYQQSQVNPVSYIPIAAIFAQGATSEHSQAVIQCDAAGVLVTYTATQGQSTLGTGTVSGARQ